MAITSITEDHVYVVLKEDDGRTHKVAVVDPIIHRFILDACTEKHARLAANVQDEQAAPVKP